MDRAVKRWTALAWLVASLAGALLAFVAFWQEPRTTTLTAISAETPAWPADVERVRIAFISDIHVDGAHMRPERVRDIAEAVSLLAPDVIVLGGDYIGGLGGKSQYRWTARGRRSDAGIVRDEAALRNLAGLHAWYGVFAVIGNHDCWWDCERMRALLDASGIVVLSNEARRIDREGAAPFWIAGLADKQTQNPNFAAAAAGVPAGAAVFAVMHNPRLFDLPNNRFAIQFAGHTHGGQVRFPLFGAPLRMSRHSELAASGVMIEGGRILFVSRGLGEVGLPVRFGAPPQIMLVELRHGASARARVLS